MPRPGNLDSMTILIADWAIRATPRGRQRLTAGHKQTAGCAFSLWPTKPLFRLRTRIERIDPTIAAHIPVVVSDLPVALLATTAVLWSYAALSSARIDNILAAGFSLGLTLMAKPSVLGRISMCHDFRSFSANPLTSMQTLLRPEHESSDGGTRLRLECPGPGFASIGLFSQ